MVDAIRRGQLTVAENLASQGFDRAERGSSSAWAFRLLRAESLVLQLKFDRATADLEQQPPDGPAFDPTRARRKYLQARAEAFRGRLPEAAGYISDGLAIPAPESTRFDLQELSGQVALRTGRQPDAERQLNALIAAAEKSGDEYHQALAMNDLGMGRLAASRFDEAISWFDKVLAFKALEPYTIYALALSNAGICYARLGDFDHAIVLQRRAIDVHERHGETVRLEQALGSLGFTHLERGEPAKSLPYLRRAFDLAEQVHADADAPVLAGNLAQAYIELAQWREAATFNDEAVRRCCTGRSTGLRYLKANAAKIAAGQGRPDEAQRLFNETLADATDDPTLQWDASAGLARLALAAGRALDANKYFEQGLQIINRTQSGLLKPEYKLSYLNSLIQFYEEYIDVLISRGEVERALEIADSSRARVLAERLGAAVSDRPTVSSFKHAAETTRTVILAYWLAPKRSALWVVTPAAVHYVPLPSEQTIAALVREYQATIGSALADPLGARQTSGDTLYEMLIAPAKAWIPSGASVLVAPDSALHGLNFETLPVDGTSRHYWIEDAQIQVIPSIGLLDAALRDSGKRTNGNQSSASASLLLFGAPTPSDPAFPPLAYGPAEMLKVASHFDARNVSRYEGPRASPAAYRDAKPENFSMIHFTAHAAANEDSPLDSAVILATHGDRYKLYARDVATQPLRAELVTVSACRAAGERAYSGEGLVGFSWAFLRAGAQRVIAGLWDVDDQSTAALMDGLYSRIAAGTPPARALREAKLAMLRAPGSLSKPYYWGPFEIFTLAP